MGLSRACKALMLVDKDGRGTPRRKSQESIRLRRNERKADRDGGHCGAAACRALPDLDHSSWLKATSDQSRLHPGTGSKVHSGPLLASRHHLPSNANRARAPTAAAVIAARRRLVRVDDAALRQREGRLLLGQRAAVDLGDALVALALAQVDARVHVVREDVAANRLRVGGRGARAGARSARAGGARRGAKTGGWRQVGAARSEGWRVGGAR